MICRYVDWIGMEPLDAQIPWHRIGESAVLQSAMKAVVATQAIHHAEHIMPNTPCRTHPSVASAAPNPRQCHATRVHAVPCLRRCMLARVPAQAPPAEYTGHYCPSQHG